jgi:hypothetical protein
MDNGINIDRRDRELNRVNEALNQYRGMLKIMESKAKQGINIELDDEIQAYKQRMRMLFEDMAPLATLERVAKGCVHSIFFAALIDEVRIAGSKTQKYLSRLNKCYELALSKKLLLLKDDYVGNREAIADIENILKIRLDNTLREKIKDIKIFECLNPFFPFRSFSTSKIADVLGLVDHVCALLKIDTAIGLYLCSLLQKTEPIYHIYN